LREANECAALLLLSWLVLNDVLLIKNGFENVGTAAMNILSFMFGCSVLSLLYS